jgi:hypothetical protein
MTNLQDMFDDSNARQFIKVSDETKEKLRQVNIGRTHSEETRALLSKKNKERSPEVVKKMIESKKGFRHSLETRAKMSASGGHSRGRKMSDDQYEKHKIVWKNQCKAIMTPLGRFDSMQGAAEAYGWHHDGPIRYRLKKFPDQFYFVECQE